LHACGLNVLACAINQGIMQLDIVTDWKEICNYVDRATKAGIYVGIASVDAAGEPSITPIGSLVLNDDCTGFFLEKFPRRIGKNAEKNTHFCILAENLGKLFLFKAVLTGKFKYLGIKLYGNFGEKTPATEREIALIKKKLPFSKLKRFSHLLFDGTPMIRRLQFTHCEAIAAEYVKETNSVKIK
jgi:hypothetical protein